MSRTFKQLKVFSQKTFSSDETLLDINKRFMAYYILCDNQFLINMIKIRKAAIIADLFLNFKDF